MLWNERKYWEKIQCRESDDLINFFKKTRFFSKNARFSKLWHNLLIFTISHLIKRHCLPQSKFCKSLCFQCFWAKQGTEKHFLGSFDGPNVECSIGFETLVVFLENITLYAVGKWGKLWHLKRNKGTPFSLNTPLSLITQKKTCAP